MNPRPDARLSGKRSARSRDRARFPQRRGSMASAQVSAGVAATAGVGCGLEGAAGTLRPTWGGRRKRTRRCRPRPQPPPERLPRGTGSSRRASAGWQGQRSPAGPPCPGERAAPGRPPPGGGSLRRGAGSPAPCLGARGVTRRGRERGPVRDRLRDPCATQASRFPEADSPDTALVSVCAHFQLSISFQLQGPSSHTSWLRSHLFTQSPPVCVERLQNTSTYWEAMEFNPRLFTHGPQQSLQTPLHFFCWRRL
ncbi:uncharacterized protein LOC129784369 [Falco peregrinus]|uniref:uncharacterized protein LOC129784369 n=1 Tax=Falco peregrinus TaxID=8954 RepID=UPI002478EA3D|nr:uncharacterized protein LOC129784369 [Falco peregrinus]